MSYLLAGLWASCLGTIVSMVSLLGYGVWRSDRLNDRGPRLAWSLLALVFLMSFIITCVVFVAVITGWADA